METSVASWLTLIAVVGAMLVVPAVAWTSWLRAPRPRPFRALVVALATTAPLAISLAGLAWVAILVRSVGRSEDTDPSRKARFLAEMISEAMNLTSIAVIGAAVVSAVIVALSWRRRGQRT